MQKVVNNLPEEAKSVISVPKTIQFKNDAARSCEEKTSELKEKMTESGLKWPCICKALAGARAKNSHLHGVVNTDEGMNQILASETYHDCDIVLQEYAHHQEKLYKLYVCGSNFATKIRRSLPDSVIFASDVHNFNNAVPFDKESYQKFNEVDELHHAKIDMFVRQFTKDFNMNLYGLDVIVETRTGRHVVLDMNYFPGYLEIDEAEM